MLVAVGAISVDPRAVWTELEDEMATKGNGRALTGAMLLNESRAAARRLAGGTSAYSRAHWPIKRAAHARGGHR